MPPIIVRHPISRRQKKRQKRANPWATKTLHQKSQTPKQSRQKVSMALSARQREIIEKTLPAGRVFFDFKDYQDYTKDATEMVFTPDLLFFAESEQEVIETVRLCRQLKMPLIVRGAGTGYSGGALAVKGGLLMSIERMNKIDINPDKRLATVGPGAITGDIFKAAEINGLFYPPDPASYLESTIAGNLAENAGGLRCKKYGVTKDYVVGFRGIDTGGNIINIDTCSPFGLSDVIIGSEGTLFVFTEIALRLIPQAKIGRTIQAVFDKTTEAALVVAEITAAGIIPCIMEYMDGDAIKCSNEYDPDNKITEGAAMLLFETDGLNAESEGEAIRDICQKYSPTAIAETDDPEKREILWMTRRNLSKAVKESGKYKISEDVCVPPSHLPDLAAFVEDLSRRFTVRINSYGHAGDGNLHVNFLGMTGSDQEENEISEGVELVFKKTLELGGTLTGEHGIGITKRDYINQEFDPPTLEFMIRLKKCLDAGDIFNPGKIF